MRFSSSIYGAAIVLAPLSHALTINNHAAPLPMRIMTQNVRYDLANPLATNEQPWPVRLPLQVAEYKFFTAHQPASMIFLEEPLKNQVDDIVSGLNTDTTEPQWKFIGRGRDDNIADNEYNPILYQPDIWELEQWWTRWLSKTPTVPFSKYPGADFPRIVTVGKFRHKATGYEVLACCTHLDDQSDEVRLGQAKVVVATANEFSEQGHGKPDLPVFIAGDFNSQPNGSAYQYVTTKANPAFVDAVDKASTIEGGYHYGDNITYTGFVPGDLERIDFVFLRQSPAGYGTPTWQVQGAGVPPDVFDNGIYLSDHRPVIVDALLKA